MTTTTHSPKLRHAPLNWKPNLTRVLHADGQAGTFVGNSEPLPGVAPRGWLGVLVRFDGESEPVDVDPDDLAVTALRDPFAAIADRLPTRYAPGFTPVPYHYPEGAVWHPVIYYPAAGGGGQGRTWLVEPFPAARADGTDGLDPNDGAGVAVLRGKAAPRPYGADRDGDWIIPGSLRPSGSVDCAYDVWADNRRDLLAAWCEAWAIAAALNNKTCKALGVKPEDVEVLLAAERRVLVGDSRYSGTVHEVRWTQIGGGDRQRVPARQMARLRDGANAVLEACVVADRHPARPELETCGGTWRETTYQLNTAGVETLQVIRRQGTELGGPRCRVCGCTDERACPEGCSWLSQSKAGPLCSACARTVLALR